VVAARLCCHVDDAPAGPTSFSRSYTGLDFEFRNDIGWWIDADLSKISFVVIYAIERKVIVGWTRAIYYQYRTTRLKKASRLRRGADRIAAASFEIAAATNHADDRTRHS